MSAALIMILIAGSAGSLVPEPTRSFVASSARAGATMGAIYFVVGRSAIQPPPSVTAVPPPPATP